MTQEDKQLLLKDLCARLPYNTNIQVKDWTILDTELKIGHIQRLQNDGIELKPYLRPMSSMTEEEEYILHDRVLLEPACRGDDDACFNDDEIVSYVDYCYSRHLDMHGLIEKGLALEAPEGMYKTK